MKTTLNAYQKSFNIKAGGGIEITPEMLAKINKFSIKELAKDDVYVRKYIMAHNGIDRDRERFPEPLLDDFAQTLAGKSLLEVHNRQSLPIGLYFDSYTEEITPEKFLELTGEKIRLPENISTAKILWGLIYMLKVDFNEKIISNIEAGIYRHASIGFKASDLIAIKGEFSQVLYMEYVPPGEALEGSIVWLGAQPGATAQKAHSTVDRTYENPLIPKTDSEREYRDKNPLIPKENEGTKSQNPLIPGRQNTKWISSVSKATGSERKKGSLIPGDIGDKEVLTSTFARFKIGVGDAKSDEREKLEVMAQEWPIDFIKREIEILQKRENPLIPI
jgi:hypothetical protein